MPRARFDQYAVEYKTEVNKPPGLFVNEVATEFFSGINLISPAYLIRPAKRIEFVVHGSIQNYSPRVMPMRIGFVQSVVAMESWALYEDNYAFVRYFKSFPMKDGSGQPWYKPEDAIDMNPQPNLLISPFRIATWDRPQFGFPRVHEGSAPRKALVREDFITCVMAQINFKNYFLHEFRWTFKGEWGTPTGLPVYQLTSETPLHAPYNQPQQIKLYGKSANDSDRMRWARLK